MRKIIIPFGILTFMAFTTFKGNFEVFSCGGCSSVASASEQKEETEKLTLKIEGMKDDDSVKKVKTVLTNVQGVKQCDVSLKDKCACLEVKKGSDHTHKDLIEAVQKAGYKVTGVVEEPKLLRRD